MSFWGPNLIEPSKMMALAFVPMLIIGTGQLSQAQEDAFLFLAGNHRVGH